MTDLLGRLLQAHSVKPSGVRATPQRTPMKVSKSSTPTSMVPSEGQRGVTTGGENQIKTPFLSCTP